MNNLLLTSVLIFTATLVVSGWVLTRWMEFMKTMHNENKHAHNKTYKSVMKNVYNYNNKHPQLTEIDSVEVLDENGDLFEFYDLDHSFTLLLN